MKDNADQINDGEWKIKKTNLHRHVRRYYNKELWESRRVEDKIALKGCVFISNTIW